ncbi:hypothetical protein BDY19DRAFT_635135 [Irpex rosettiformis]|uniref:Uncharacterized protein n=1 Tax=Irpex rosettiformis TaxID=378272 RepID=A0ACB8UC03_9APHY|nr:hypothetical protein BDY19DRAFT_635135 [Irpex rosettiformis]
MDLYATRPDPLNTDFLDSRDVPLYHVSTHSPLFRSGTTTIYKFTGSGSGIPQMFGRTQAVMVAEIEWHSWSRDILRFQGRSMNMKDYINKSGLFGSGTKTS